MLDSGFLEFKLDYARTKELGIGDVVYSENLLAGGYVWRIKCYPRGVEKEDRGEYLSIYLELASLGRDVRAVFDVFLMDKDGAPSPEHQWRCVHAYPPKGFIVWGWSHFVERRKMEEDKLMEADGTVTFVCGVVVMRHGDRAAHVPPGDVASHLGGLLSSTFGSDVVFSVGDKTFPAHRAVLAARSPVFRAALLGSMAEAAMPVVTLDDIHADTFEDMLHFMYTDTLPRPDDDGQQEESDCSPLPATTDRFLALLVAADRYALDMLKLVCAQKLNDVMSLDNVTTILQCAELNSCTELKSKCLDLVTEDKNFEKLVLTEGYSELVQNFPSLAEEIKVIKERVESQNTGQNKELTFFGRIGEVYQAVREGIEIICSTL